MDVESAHVGPKVLVPLGAVLGVAVLTDLRSSRIPNWLTFPAMALALLVHLMQSGFAGLVFALKGIALGIALLLVPYLRGGLGAGDAKLLGAVGGFLGSRIVFVAFLFTALVGGVYALALLARRRALGATVSRYFSMIKLLALGAPHYLPPDATEQPERMRYGLAIAAGTVLALLFAQRSLSGPGLTGF